MQTNVKFTFSFMETFRKENQGFDHQTGTHITLIDLHKTNFTSSLRIIKYQIRLQNALNKIANIIT